MVVKAFLALAGGVVSTAVMCALLAGAHRLVVALDGEATLPPAAAAAMATSGGH